MTLIDIPLDKKLVILFRMEPGSLGPEGQNYIQEFCDFAQVQLQASAKPYITWAIVPRFDKTLSEMEFQISGKKVPETKAKQYLKVFDENLSDFEDELENNLEAIVNQFFGR